MLSSITDRQREIINYIMDDYLETGMPISSNTLVSKYNLPFSSATVRKEMSILEQINLLESPFTYSGRVPTDMAFKVYVRNLLELYQISVSDKIKLEEFYKDAKIELDELLKSTAQLLSNVSSYVGIVAAPNSSSTAIRRVELISIVDNLILVVMITNSDSILQTKLKLSQSISQEDLYKISRFFSSFMEGKEINEIQDQGFDFLKKDIQNLHLDKLTDDILFILQNIVYFPPDSNVYSEGWNALYENLSQFANHEEIDKKDIVHKISNHKYLLSLLKSISSEEQVGIKIGLDVGDKTINGVSILSKSYFLNNKTVGFLGILGMNRMPYQKIIPILDYSSRMLSKVLNEISSKNQNSFVEESDSYIVKFLPNNEGKYQKYPIRFIRD